MPTNHRTAYELFKPKPVENKHLQSLSNKYLEVSEMTTQERQFLNALVLRNKPKKILELGVSAGSSSVIMLNAIKNSPGAKLHAIDYVKEYYLDSSKDSGFIVDYYPELKKKWQLYTDGLALRFLDEIGGGIDFCFIDTVHMNPGEILDTLMVLPYLKDDAIIAYHDVNLPTFRPQVEYNIQRTFTNNLLMSTVHGYKYVQGDFSWTNDKRTHFPNIGAIKINPETKNHAFELFNLLTIKWGYCPSQQEERQILTFFAKHYDEYLVNYAKRVFAYQRATPDYAETLSTTKMAKVLVKKVMGPKAARAMISFKRQK